MIGIRLKVKGVWRLQVGGCRAVNHAKMSVECAKGLTSEASKGGMKVGRIKDPLYKDSYFGITPPTFIPPFEAPDNILIKDSLAMLLED